MSEPVRYRGQTTTGPSYNLWYDCPQAEIIADPNIGFIWHEDFLTYDATDLWVENNATTGTMILQELAGGQMLLDAGASTQHQGVDSFQAVPQATAGAPWLVAAEKDMWFEARVKITYPANQFFCGLATIDTTVFASGENSVANHIGFEMNTTTIGANVAAAPYGELYFFTEKAGSRDESNDLLATLTTATWHKIGFKVKGQTTSDFTVQPFYDNAALTTVTDTDDIPVSALVPTFVACADGTSQITVHIDWIRIAQLR